jgi:Zn-finger nucleic acid-binding protein
LLLKWVAARNAQSRVVARAGKPGHLARANPSDRVTRNAEAAMGVSSSCVGSFCYFCGKRGLPGATCGACGIAIPDPSAPDGIATALMCPRCVTVALAPIVLAGAGPGLTCHTCAQCHGVLLTARSWCALVEQPALVTALETTVPRPAAPTELLALLSCPACKREMERGRFAASSNVVVDVCILHGMWLDRGELTDVVKHASVRGALGLPGGDLAVEVQRALPAVDAANKAAAHGGAPTKGVGLTTILLVGGLVLALLGGLATLRSFVMVKDQMKNVTNAAASASGDLK